MSNQYRFAWTPEADRRLIAARAKAVPIKVIAYDLGCSHSTVENRIRHLRLPPPPHKWDLHMPRIKALLDEGVTSNELAEALGISVSHAYAILYQRDMTHLLKPKIWRRPITKEENKRFTEIWMTGEPLKVIRERVHKELGAMLTRGGISARAARLKLPSLSDIRKAAAPEKRKLISAAGTETNRSRNRARSRPYTPAIVPTMDHPHVTTNVRDK